MNGLDPLQPGTIRDWCDAMAMPLCREELAIIFALDSAFLAAWRDELAADG